MIYRILMVKGKCRIRVEKKCTKNNNDNLKLHNNALNQRIVVLNELNIELKENSLLSGKNS